MDRLREKLTALIYIRILIVGPLGQEVGHITVTKRRLPQMNHDGNSKCSKPLGKHAHATLVNQISTGMVLPIAWNGFQSLTGGNQANDKQHLFTELRLAISKWVVEVGWY